MQCESTQVWRTVNNVVAPIVSMRNKDNPYGIKHTHGKNAGKLKKTKLLTQKEIEDAEAQVSNGQH